MKKGQNPLFKAFILWLPFAATITILCGLVYVAVQQNFRQSANDPQIQMAEDTAVQLGSGQTADQLIPKQQVDIAQSLAPFIIVYSEDGKIISSNAVLNNKAPELPDGVLQKAARNHELRFTWQPAINSRNAVVVVEYSGKNSGFVLVGRSLREIEIREALLEMYVGAAWIVGLVATAVICLICGIFL